MCAQLIAVTEEIPQRLSLSPPEEANWFHLFFSLISAELSHDFRLGRYFGNNIRSKAEAILLAADYEWVFV